METRGVKVKTPQDRVENRVCGRGGVSQRTGRVYPLEESKNEDSRYSVSELYTICFKTDRWN